MKEEPKTRIWSQGPALTSPTVALYNVGRELCVALLHCGIERALGTSAHGPTLCKEIGELANKLRDLGARLNVGEAALKAIHDGDATKLRAAHPLDNQHAVAEVGRAVRAIGATLAMIGADALADAGMLDAGLNALVWNEATIVCSNEDIEIVTRKNPVREGLVGRA